MVRKTSAMVESGLLAALAIVFALISTYVPILGALVNFIWPLPIIVCCVRNGLRWAVMTLAVSGAVIAMLLTPLNAFVLVVVFGFLGLVIGECLWRKMDPLKLLAISSVAALISMSASVAVTFFLIGADPVALFFGFFDEALKDMANIYAAQGLSAEQIAEATNSAQDSFKLIRLVLPASFILSAPLLAFLNYWAAGTVLRRLGERLPALPPFTEIAFPRWFFVPYALSLLIVFTFQGQDDKLLYLIGLNVQMFFNIVLVLQGVSVAFWYIKNKNLPKWWGTVAVVLIFVSQFVAQYVSFIGAFDLFLDFRKLKK